MSTGTGPADDGGDLPFDPDAELEPIELEIGEALDLHGFAPRDVARVVQAYLEAAVERGLREVRLIHGKGKGVQRARVAQILGESPHVEAFSEGPPERGGWGATVVRLRGAAR